MNSVEPEIGYSEYRPANGIKNLVAWIVALNKLMDKGGEK